MTPLDACAEELETMEKAVTAGREWCSSQGDTPDLMRRDDDTECLLLIAAACGQNEDAENMAYLAAACNALPALLQERRLLVALEKASRECRGVWAALNDLDAFRRSHESPEGRSPARSDP